MFLKASPQQVTVLVLRRELMVFYSELRPGVCLSAAVLGLETEEGTKKEENLFDPH